MENKPLLTTKATKTVKSKLNPAESNSSPTAKMTKVAKPKLNPVEGEPSITPKIAKDVKPKLNHTESKISPKPKMTKVLKAKSKLLSKGQRIHIRRVKQEARKSSPEVRREK
jgi:hypothetical protein